MMEEEEEEKGRPFAVKFKRRDLVENYMMRKRSYNDHKIIQRRKKKGLTYDSIRYKLNLDELGCMGLMVTHTASFKVLILIETCRTITASFFCRS